MEFKDKYTTKRLIDKLLTIKPTEEKGLIELEEEILKEQDKIILTDDNFALCELINDLNKGLEKLRISNLQRR